MKLEIVKFTITYMVNNLISKFKKIMDECRCFNKKKNAMGCDFTFIQTLQYLPIKQSKNLSSAFTLFQL